VKLLLAAGAAIAAAAPAHRPEIAITIDDLPVHAPYPPGLTPLKVNRQMIAALKDAHVPVTAFVNAANVTDEGTREALSEWRSAGFVLGNHSWSHPHLSELTLAQFEEQLTKDEPILSKLGSGSDWRWFRYPFLDEGKDQAQRNAARRLLLKHGYRIADVTAGFSDWAWTPAYARCTSKNDRTGVADLETMYVAAAKQSILNDRETSHELYGRDIPYVLLMHVSAMSAHMMPKIIRIYRDAGYRFVSLPKAESDPAYRAYTDLERAPPPSPGEMAKARGVTLPSPPDLSARLDSICA
jgi:peptidoglycan/xylan/chitin deacetylase (PgdA/CDA1 family)